MPERGCPAGAGRREAGIDGEERGARFLVSRGYRILERNYRTPLGEIDIIARDRSALVFVEVKLRCGRSFGGPQEALTRRQQERIVRAALQYVKARRLLREALRFDVLAIGPGPDDMELICSAFSAEGYTY